ncbi:MAG: Gfo/Idh/MocA family oxidoreductase [Victivallales bacterium]|nr:Gfo/Idh/MocA family oxidoreductase [Victivallales bacterium]
MTPEGKLKVGVIGVGALGRHHARLYKQSKNAEVVGIYDVNPETAAGVAAEFDLPIIDNMFELARQCDAVSIAVPATRHHEVTVPILNMGVHVLVEKPIAATVSEGEDMVEAAAANHVVLAVGHVERFNPAMDFLEKNAHNTRFAEVHRLAKYPPPRPGLPRRGTEVSVIHDLMIHDLDLVMTMFGTEVEHIDAVGIPVLSETEDIASVRIKFVNGSVANITASRVSMEPQRRFRIFQSDCYISMDYGKHNGMVLKKTRVGLARKDINLSEKNALQYEIEDFLAAVGKTMATGEVVTPRVCGRQGLRALRLAERITDEIKNYNEKYGIVFSR